MSSIREDHLSRHPLPLGFRIFENNISVAGLPFRRDDATEFCWARRQSLELQPDPRNAHDRNAVEVWGVSKGWLFTSRRLIGYVPKDIAARLAATGLVRSVKPRLMKTWAGDQGGVDVVFQLIGPADLYDTYKPATKKRPRKKKKASAPQ